MAKEGAGSSRLVRIFVRIGALRRFHVLTQKTADLPVEVKWDRRRSDRGDTSTAEGSPAQPDRRQKPPYTWDVADFVVVEEPGPEAKAAAKKE